MAGRASFYKGPFAGFFIWWLFWSAAGTFIVHRFGYSWTVSIIDAAGTQLDLTVAGYVINMMLRYYRPSSKNLINVLGFTLALAMLFSFVLLPLFLPALVEYVSPAAGYEDFLRASLSIRFVIGWMQLLFAAAFSWIWFFMEEQQENEIRKSDTERLARVAELAQLRQQLQPHFLFNSLNSINALVGSQPEMARRMIQQLSDFLRGTLKKDDRQLISLEEELNHLSLYLEIEKVRFGYRLKTVVEANETVKPARIPPLLLQPIVENAIKFGLYDTIGEITISIRAMMENNYLVIKVDNPFDPVTTQPRRGTGFGLNSISRRLYLIYFQSDLLETSMDGNIFSTTIKIPQA